MRQTSWVAHTMGCGVATGLHVDDPQMRWSQLSKRLLRYTGVSAMGGTRVPGEHLPGCMLSVHRRRTELVCRWAERVSEPSMRRAGPARTHTHAHARTESLYARTRTHAHAHTENMHACTHTHALLFEYVEFCNQLRLTYTTQTMLMLSPTVQGRAMETQGSPEHAFQEWAGQGLEFHQVALPRSRTRTHARTNTGPCAGSSRVLNRIMPGVLKNTGERPRPALSCCH